VPEGNFQWGSADLLAISEVHFQIKGVIPCKRGCVSEICRLKPRRVISRNCSARRGTVETVRIITDRDTGRSKGFGFVEMQDGGDKAITEINGKDFKGRAMTVNEARPMPSRDSRGGGFNRY
jgi:hypothetical protein